MLVNSGSENTLGKHGLDNGRQKNVPEETEFAPASNEDFQNDQAERFLRQRRSVGYKFIELFQWLKRWSLAILGVQKFQWEITHFRHTRTLVKSGFFDEDFYIRAYPDVMISKLKPVRHYLLYGGVEGRNPSELFDSSAYLLDHPEVEQSGMNPLVHFLLYQNGKNVKGETRYRQLTEKFLTRHLETQLRFQDRDAIGDNLNNLEIQMIKESPYFDADYYWRVNADVQARGIAPEIHFYHFGWKEGRNPGPLFDTFYYLSANPDVKERSINPLIHFITSGKAEGRLPKPFEYDESQCIAAAGISDIQNIEAIDTPFRIAVVCHWFHQELADEFIMYFRQIPFPCDFFVTTTEQILPYLKQLFGQEMPDASINISAVPNIGRDVAPFLSVFANHLHTYDLVCKVHSKKSSHDKNLEGWRTYLLDNLLGNPKIIRRIAGAFMADERLGIVWPVPHPYLKNLGIDVGWGPKLSRETNRQKALQYFSDLQPPALDDTFHFPVGNMFWFRPSALSYLNTLKFNSEVFNLESGYIDGTLSHTLERMIGKMAEKAGFIHKTVFFSQESVLADRETGIDFRVGSKKILFVAHDLFRAGAEMILLHLMSWLKLHTAYKLIIVAIKKGNDGGKMLAEYRRVAKVYLLDEMQAHHPEQEAFAIIKEQTGNVDLIYGNTILSATVFQWLEVFGVPVITHIHELEASIKKYTSPEIRNQMKKATTAYIACSKPVYDNMLVNYDIQPALLHQVDEFIRPDFIGLPEKTLQRQMHGLPADKVIVWGCGTIYWRKGTDLFIETAGELKRLGITDFVFCWIGSNHWNNDLAEWGNWQMQESRIRQLQLEDTVLFLGEKENPKEYFKAGDIFYLPSREDPFPLVCLEAAECELPVVCFADAGGIPAFVENDAGFVVPFLDISKAAGAIGHLINDHETRIKKGKIARGKLLARHTDDIAVPQILKICRTTMRAEPAISVIVPVYNQAPFLRERLNSILKQQFRDVEIIILDDASTDNSVEIASEYLFHPAVRIAVSETNSGSPFRQWQKGITMARGTLVWIAEGDDFADPGFLTSLIPAFNDDAVVMAYCGSHRVDQEGVVTKEYYLRSGHYHGLGFPPGRWLDDYQVNGRDEITCALAIRNTIPNVSAVLFRRSVFDDVNFQEIFHLRTAGDWRLYLSVLKQGKLAYFHQHLNFHRVHGHSVVGASKKEAALTLPDYFQVHRFILEEFEISPATRKLMTDSVALNLRNLWPELSDEDFEKLYDISSHKT